MRLSTTTFLRGLAVAATLSSTPAAAAETVFAPYAFLIGEWEIGEEGAPPAAVTRVRWGPNRSYIWISTALLGRGGEVPHYEGMLVWNGVRKDLDMLLTLDPATGRVQEQGRVWVAPGGEVVRDVTAVYGDGVTGPDGRKVGPTGATFTFQQRFRQVSPGKIETSMMRKTETGWTPTFPGSDSVVMRLRAR